MIWAHYPHYLSLSIMRENKALFNMKVSNSENNMPKLFETERIFLSKIFEKMLATDSTLFSIYDPCMQIFQLA